MLAPSHTSLLDRLPQTRGRMRAGAELAKATWFQVGGLAEVLYRPQDTQDLAEFLQRKPGDVPYLVLGAGSNLLVRDGGIDGVVIRLGRGFAEAHVAGDRLVAGAACLNANLVPLMLEYGIGGLEFLSGIPGSIGGALFMNAGAYGAETKDVLVEAEVLDPQGNVHIMTPQTIHYSYRHSGLPEGWIFTRAVLQGVKEDTATVQGRISAIAEARSGSQPIRSRTGGSTFKNPQGHKAWQLIDAAGCRGLRVGAAEMSTQHCNFMINTGGATAEDLEDLGEEVVERVRRNSGITLEWEIKRIGRAYAPEQMEGVA